MSASRWDVTPEWKAAWPGASAGVLIAKGIAFDGRPAPFDDSLRETERQLRDQFGEMEREQLRKTGHLAAYHRYYRSFGQNYHVQHQIESIAQKGRTIPERNMLVEIGFKWELRNGLLTAVHDLSHIEHQVVLDVAGSGVVYALPNNKEAFTVKTGDMYFRDGEAVLSSIIGGPSAHSRVTKATTECLLTIYGVPGVSEAAIDQHLQDIWGDLERYAPGAELVERSTRSS